MGLGEVTLYTGKNSYVVDHFKFKGYGQGQKVFPKTLKGAKEKAEKHAKEMAKKLKTIVRRRRL